MKNLKNKSRIFIAALVALFSVVFTSAASASGNTAYPAISVKYIGAVNNAPIFQLSFTNEKEEQYEIKITDKDNTIYSETIKGKELVRKFQFVNNGSDEDVLYVEIKNVSTNKIITYKINPATTVEAETELVSSL